MNKKRKRPRGKWCHAKTMAFVDDVITKSVEEALLLGVVQETNEDHIHHVLPLNVNIKKNNGKLRLIFNTMFINQFMVVPPSNIHNYTKRVRKYSEIHRGLTGWIAFIISTSTQIIENTGFF